MAHIEGIVPTLADFLADKRWMEELQEPPAQLRPQDDAGGPSLPFYVVSDTHFWHKNIIKYCNRPYDHEVMMVKRWKQAIKHTDTILHLGDVFFGGQQGYEDYRDKIAPQLPGKKYLILGNHDKKTYDYEAIGFKVVKPFKCEYRGYTVSFDHYPRFLPEDSIEKWIHVHGHIHNHRYARDEEGRDGNINVSVEVMDYRPHRCTRLLNKEIRARNQRPRYRNNKGYRQRAAAWQAPTR